MEDELKRLVEITRKLRAPGGCDWDRAQNYESMRPHLVEESYEVIDAVNRGDYEGLKEELGDLLFLVHFFARMGEEENRFTLEEIARTVNDKLVRRHPHVFGDVEVENVEEILSNWESIKRQEKAEKVGDDESSEEGEPARKSIMAKREDFLPSLFRAMKIQDRAARVGFDWKDTGGVLSKLQEEIGELKAEMDKSNPAEFAARKGEDGVPKPGESLQKLSSVEEELGDVLFTVVNLARRLGANPELALNHATDKFIARFKGMEWEAWSSEKELEDFDEAGLEELWERSKKSLKK